MKVLRKYLFHIQKSVFEGGLTPKSYRDLLCDLRKVSIETDSILFYISYNEKQMYKESLYRTCEPMNILI
ncbi:MAG: CRISPR-associated endonuclease Cas2 [Erysipelotrichaceae bacterium]|nr:CRISPR-associated endonuclease Cas2 [Erysipelotrichaceae bacterium]